MMEDKYTRKFQQFLEKINKSNSKIDEKLFLNAFELSYEAHKEQFLMSEMLYFDHCLNVAEILIELKMDSETVIGGLLHAITNDTNVSEQDISDQFGDSVGSLVKDLAQINKLKFKSRTIKQHDNLRKLILSIVKDIRALIIKFAERLDRLRVIDSSNNKINEKLVYNIAEETMAVYVPLVHRLGIYKIKHELEVLSFKFLNREIYDNIKIRLVENKDEQQIYINHIIEKLQKAITREKISAEIYGRSKSIYSIHKKMVNRGYSFDKINDLLAIRIIVEDKESHKDKYKNCYTALSVVQNLFKPVQSLYNDYIQNPRDNGYQSIHIKVIYNPNNSTTEIKKIIEIQIRTNKMHEDAESGLAAHWLYKEGKQKKDKIDEKLISIREKILDEARDPEKFIESLKIDDLFSDKIFIFSPDYDLWQLPKDSTPIDFAYNVHTDVGFHCIGAKVNKKIVPLDYKLKSGETVEILTSNAQRPNSDWLNFVKTSRAKNKIKRWIRETQFEESVRLGEELLIKNLKHFNLKINSEELINIATRCDFNSKTKFYEAIGRGDITTNYIIKKIAPEKLQVNKEDSIFKKFIKRATGNDNAIRVQGLDNLLINFGLCCNPLPGDRIIGFVTKGRGVVIHRTDCKNVTKLVENLDRNIDVKWALDSERRFVAKIKMISKKNIVFLHDVTESLLKLNTNIVSVDMKEKDSLVKNTMAIEVLNINHLNRIINKIRKIKGVLNVDRINGNGNSEN